MIKVDMKDLRSGKNKKEYHQISMMVVRKMVGQWPFDIYIERAKDVYTKIYLKDDAIDQNHITSYNDQKGVQDLYVHNEDHRKYTLYVSDVVDSFFKEHTLKTVSTEQYTEMVKEVADLSMVEIFIQNNIDYESVRHATTAMKGCINILQNDPKAMGKFLQGMSGHP